MKHGEAFSKNVELVAYHDLEGKPGLQMAMQEVGGRYYLYLSHFRHSGWAILDVTDPAEPRYLKFIPGPEKKGQFTPKIQVADGLMVTALGQLFPVVHGTSWADPYEAGVYIWDVKDPENPKWLSSWETGGGIGVHRFYYSGGRYVHLSASCPGYMGFIYRILDVSDPTRPVEAGRWWMQEQWEAGATGTKGTLESLLPLSVMHGPAYPKGDIAYVSWGGAGMIVLDISNIAVPKFLGQLKHSPPLSSGPGARCHTVVPLSERPYALMTSEGGRFPYFSKEFVNSKAQPLNFIGMVDISDPTNPTLISMFPYPEIPEGYPYKNFNEIPGWGAGPFGPHNLHEPHYHPALEDRNDRAYCAYFNAGLRVYDISDPFVPREIAYYIPPTGDTYAFNNEAGTLFPGPNLSLAEEVLVDKRGYIYMLEALHSELHILRCTV